MVIKVYISGISGNKEVKKRQQRVLLILDSKNVKYEVIDIAEPGAEETKDFMQNNSTGFGATIGDPNPRHPLPPQIFNDEVYCGDYDMFDMANEIDEMEAFLKLDANSLNEQTPNAEIKLKNGDISIDEKIEKVIGKSENDESKENEVPNEQNQTEEAKSEKKEVESKSEAVDVESENKEEETKPEEKTEEVSEKKDEKEIIKEATEETEENDGVGDEKRYGSEEKEASPDKSE